MPHQSGLKTTAEMSQEAIGRKSEKELLNDIVLAIRDLNEALGRYPLHLPPNPQPPVANSSPSGVHAITAILLCLILWRVW